MSDEGFDVDGIYDPKGLEAALHRAARHGARDALKEIGLGEPDSGEKVRELLNWLDTVKILKRGFFQTTVRIFTASFWILMLGGILSYIKDHIK